MASMADLIWILFLLAALCIGTFRSYRDSHMQLWHPVKQAGRVGLQCAPRGAARQQERAPTAVA